jgi:hypothetical protein
MDPTLIPQIINVLLVIGGITAGGVTLEHTLENYVMSWIPQQFKTVCVPVFSYIGLVLARMATGTPLADATSGLGSVIMPVIMAGIAFGVHKTPVGATPVNVITPPPPSATPPPPPPDPPKVVPPAVALLLGLLLLAGHAKAGAMEIGVPVTPSAGASYIENTWVTMPTMFDLNGGNFKLNSAGFFVGWQTTWQWGPTYGAGLILGGNVIAGTPTEPTAGHLSGGAVFNFETVEIGIVGDNQGLHAGLTKSW